MPDKSTHYRWFRLVGRITLVVLKIILLFLEIVKRYLDLG